MKQSLNELELEVILEAQKLVNLERVVLSGDDELEVSELVISTVIKSIEKRILHLLCCDGSIGIGALFIKLTQTSLESEEFKQVAERISNEYSYRMTHEKVYKERVLKEEIPESILLLMEDVAVNGDEIKELVGDKFYNHYFMSQYLVYRANEKRYIVDSTTINKTELFNMVFGEKGIETNILKKINEVQKKHKTIFKKETETVNMDTAKKKLFKVIPSKHKDGTMDQSEKLNIFQQHALLIIFLIDKTSYQRFLSNAKTQNPPDSRIFEEVKKAIEKFSELQPISGITDKLFMESSIEDTYHFALFNALTQLTTEIFNAMNEIINISNKYDSLSMLFIIDQLIENVPTYTTELMDKYFNIVTETVLNSEISENKELIYNVIEDEEGLDYVKKTMLNMFEKYSTFQQNSENYDFTESAFKRIVKEFYTSGDGDNPHVR